MSVWASIGAAADLVMSHLMLPSSTVIAGLALAFAAAHALTPWSRRARARCRALCQTEVRGTGVRGALLDGGTYSLCCVVCCAGVMVALVVLGMSNILLVLGAVAMLVYKLV